jgi:hypothetical protein
MTFVHLSLLAGGAFVALPIVLHLLMRRKPRPVEFPALRFIQPRHDTNQRRLRLRHLLLLALRIAAIGLLALALARPSVKFSGTLGSQQAPVAAALVFDTSTRMEYRSENRTRLEAAQAWGAWILGQLPRDSQFAVLDTRPATGPVWVDRSLAGHRLQRLSSSGSSRPLADVLEDALRLLGQSDLARKELYVFTDMARVGWPADSAAELQNRIADLSEVGIYVIDVGVENPTNSALGELRLSSQVLSSQSPLEIETELSCVGSAPEETIQRTVELYLSPRARAPTDPAETTAQKEGTRIVTLASGESQPIAFELGGLTAGTHQGYVQIVGQDGLACDDRRFFTVDVQPAWRVLLAAPDPADRYALYLTEAISPAEYRLGGWNQFDCETIALSALPGRDLDGYSAVCLLDPTPLAAETWEKLADFARSGRGVAVFLGRNAEPIQSFNLPPAQQLLAGKLNRQARNPHGDLYLAPRVAAHPILSGFGELGDTVPWSLSPVFRYWELSELAEGVHLVVPFSDGRPAILQRPLESGRVLTMVTPISDLPNEDPWNLLPVGEASWPFVILANGMASYLVGGSEQRLNYFAGQTAVLNLDPQSEYRFYALTTPDQVEVRLTPDLAKNVLPVTATDTAGNYRVAAGGSSGGVERGFSVNLPSQQTQLTRLADEDLRAVFGSADYRVARDRDDLEGKISVGRVGRELFPFFIVLVALALGVEHVLANRFYRD